MSSSVKRYLVITLVAGLLPGVSPAQESFRVNLDKDGDTIADMRPVFLKYQSEALPSISPKEVARRYQRLFDQSTAPEVRIDALNRLSNLQSVADDALFTPEQEQRVYQQVLGSYDEIMGRGSYQGRLDEMLYQMAKAYAYTGQGEKSVERLQQLAGLYPDSPLVPEARFRIAEAAFSAGEYADAERDYLNVLSAQDGSASHDLKQKARYMLGWSQYKQKAYDRAGVTFIAVLDDYAHDTQNFQAIPRALSDIIDDTFRVVGVIAARTGGDDALFALLQRTGQRSYEYLLYDRLADYYAANQNAKRSVAVSDAFILANPEHASTPAFRAQIVDVLQMAGDPVAARLAQESYLDAYQSDQAHFRLHEEDRERWLDYANSLAEFHYHRASQLSQTPQATKSSNREAVKNGFVRAASFYNLLALRTLALGDALHLAGDASLQAERYADAYGYYQRAAYEAEDFLGASDSAWAALNLQSQGLREQISYVADLQDYDTQARRFAQAWPEDLRMAELQTDVATRMLAAENYEQAIRFAEQAVKHDHAAPAYRYSGYLILAQAHSALEHYGAAERASRSAIVLADSEPTLNILGPDKQALQVLLQTAVYRQGEAAANVGETSQAVAHFQRIAAIAPGSVLAIKGHYEATATLMQAQQWQASITELQRFRNSYPQHRLTAEVSDKLVYAYQQSDQPLRAADELMHSAGATVSLSTRLRAAELYHQGHDYASRDRLYRDYLAGADQPATADEHVRQQTMRYRLIESDPQPEALQIAMIDLELASPWHTDDTLKWAAAGALALGQQASQKFASITLTHPLSTSLARKQAAMETAKMRYQQTAQLGGEDVQTETFYHRAELYRVLAADLMSSSRPEDLSDLELAQYDILLEEQAYPFEETAIRLHAENHARVRVVGYDRWIEKSLESLRQLYPGRYARDSRWIQWGVI